MTSSLVGSEMCIRDSPISVSRSHRRFVSVFPSFPSPRCRLPGVGREAVSYTHLTLPTICSV
eukprot:6101333-Prorocentrum_lima.AAC.1